MPSVRGHGYRHVRGRERLIGLLLEALGSQVQQRVEGRSRRGRRRLDPRQRSLGEVVRVGGEEGLGGVAVGEGGQGEERDGGRRVHAGEDGVVVPRQGEGKVSTRRGGAATKTSRALEEALLLFTLLFSKVLLVLENLQISDQQKGVFSFLFFFYIFNCVCF